MDNPFPLESLADNDETSSEEEDDDVWDMHSNTVSRSEVFELIRDIKDPEHEYTLEALKVVRRRQIEVRTTEQETCHVVIEFTPTVPHCTLATTIGLCIREKLRRDLQIPAKVQIRVTPGRHSIEAEINKQVNDKERVVAALENPDLRRLVDVCLDFRPGEL
jgi:metal-sulfur cluster biosynthetic enzyme